MKVVISGQNPEDRLPQFHYLRKQLDSHLKPLSLPKERIFDIRLAADELVTNPFKHNEGETKIVFFAHIDLLHGTMAFAVKSRGYEQERNRQEIQNALVHNVPAALDAENKRGLYLVRNLLPGARFSIEFGLVAVAFPICPLLAQSSKPKSRDRTRRV